MPIQRAGQQKGVGAICSELAAEFFGLDVLEKGCWAKVTGSEVPEKGGGGGGGDLAQRRET